jgi:hypothetical protein
VEESIPTAEPAIALLALLLEEDGVSIHKACKQLGLSMSEMMRVLTVLGPSGTGLVEQEEVGRRKCLFLTETGRSLGAQS